MITATSSSTSVATVSVSGNTVTVTGKAYGSATITVKVAEGTNHTAPANKTCTVQVNLFNSTLNANSWAAIKAASDADEGANYWSAGDTKAITINGTVGNFTSPTFLLTHSFWGSTTIPAKKVRIASIGSWAKSAVRWWGSVIINTGIM